MHRKSTRVITALAAGAALAVMGVNGAGASGAQGQRVQAPARLAADGSHASIVPGTRLWVSRYNSRANHSDIADAVAVSPDGKTMVVTGSSLGATSGEDYATVAYRTATGTQLWAKRYNGPGNGLDNSNAAAISPDGKTVFVTGFATGATSDGDYTTIAYRVATGRLLWIKRYNGPGNGFDDAHSLAVSPDGTKVFVTGSVATHRESDYATVAYRATTGALLWVKRYGKRGRLGSAASAVTVSPGGGRVFVTGLGGGAAEHGDYATVAYRAATGAQLWARRYNGPANGFDEAAAVTASPTGGIIFVTGRSDGTTTGQDYATVAYRAATGARLWVARFNAPGSEFDNANAMAVSPDGKSVFVTGITSQASTGGSYATIGYDASTGGQLWASFYQGPGGGSDAVATAVSPSGKKVFVTGSSNGGSTSDDYATIAYDTAAGSQLWAGRYDGPVHQGDNAHALAVSPHGGMVFVTGSSDGGTTKDDYATVAYHG